jgi:hypothetical protein
MIGMEQDMGVPGDADMIHNMTDSHNIDPAMKEQIKGLIDAGDLNGAMDLLMGALEGMAGAGGLDKGIDGAMAQNMLDERPMM